MKRKDILRELNKAVNILRDGSSLEIKTHLTKKYSSVLSDLDIWPYGDVEDSIARDTRGNTVRSFVSC